VVYPGCAFNNEAQTDQEGLKLTDTKSIYPADSYHAGLRLAIVGSMLAGFVLGALAIVPWLAKLLQVDVTSLFCFRVIGGLVTGAGIGWLVENYLYRIWPSGREIEIDAQGLTLREPSGENQSVAWDKHVNILAWQFKIKQRAWVPKGWYCLSCQLVQDDQTIIFYTFIKPGLAEKLPQWEAFKALVSPKDTTQKAQEHNLADSPQQVRLRGVEQERWLDGAELQPKDFTTLIQQLDSHLSNWPPEH
jgi:hypothetical protein